jgi:peptidyl-prolyl cis-trans isomerase B (cyclophilin B)
VISVVLSLLLAQAPARPAPQTTKPTPRPPATRPAPTGKPAAPPAPSYFTSPYSLDELRNKQAVIETTAGAIVLQLLPEAAPNHVGLFVKLARDGGYVGTTFHRVIPNGMIQGGDPVSKDPAKTADYGTGGLNQLRAESRAEPPTAGAVLTALAAGLPDSGGQQFIILASDQPAVQGQYTVFARVVDGLEIVRQISSVEADAAGLPRARIEITGVTIRDTPVDPFPAATAADLAAYRAVVETTLGTIELEMLPDKALETVRAFLQWADAGVYDGVRVHRVAPHFVIQTGALAFRDKPLTSRQQQLVRNLPPEFTDTPNVPGVVSIARGDDPGSGSTSFFICIGSCRAIDGKYTVFARVVGGQDVLDRMAAVPVDGETPREPIIVTRIRAVKSGAR